MAGWRAGRMLWSNVRESGETALARATGRWMRLWQQGVVTIAILAAGGVIAAGYSPTARQMLERAGVANVLERVGLLGPLATNEAAKVGAKASDVAVVAAEPEMRLREDRLAGIGTVRGKQSVIVTAGAAGRIVALPVQAGLVVKAGDLLLELDSEIERLAAEQARLALLDAQENFDRLSKLKATGSASDQQLQAAQLALDTATVSLKSAEHDLAQRKIFAPIGGLVGVIDLGVGDRVAVDTQIARIEDRSSLIVDYRVPERFSGRLSVGQEVMVAPLSAPDAGLRAEISTLDNRVDEASRSLRVQATIAHPPDGLRAGMALRISMVLKGDALPAVDPLAVQWSSDGPFVWLVRDGKAQKLPIRIAERDSDAVLVEADFMPGDMVVSEGVQSLRAGSAVQVTGAGGAAPKS